MKAKLICSMMAMSVVSLTAAAEDFSWGNVTFQPRVYAGYANYELKSSDFNTTYQYIDGKTMTESRPIKLDFFPQEEVQLHDKIQFSGLLLGIGGAIASGPFFSDFYYQATLDEVAYSGNEQPFEKNPFAYLYAGDVNAQHSDWALSLGYRVNSQWSLFAGYKSGSTEWDHSFKYILKPPSQPDLVEDAKLNASFDQDGPFLGTSYSFLIGSGVLTLKAAYAYLDGSYKWNGRGVTYPPYSGIYPPHNSNDPFIAIEQWNMDGNSNAYSIGVSWTQSLTDQLGLSIGANYHNYKFDLSGSAKGSMTNLDQASAQANGGSLTEELFTLTASFTYVF